MAHLAAVQLGTTEKGRGNLAEAERWWRYAAAQNDPAAAFNLAGMVDESAPEIPRWLLIAIRFGDRKLRFPAVHRLSRLISAPDRQACLAQLARYGTQALKAGRQGVAAEFMICRGILLRDGGATAEAESSLRAAAQQCAESSDIEGEAQARSELLVLLARPDPPAARRELLRITELGVELSALRGDPQTEGELNLALERLRNED